MCLKNCWWTKKSGVRGKSVNFYSCTSLEPPSAPMVEQSMAKWFSTEHTKNYDSRDILLRLYSGHACTVIRPGTYAHPLEDNDEMGLREMIRLQGHDAEGIYCSVNQASQKKNFRIY